MNVVLNAILIPIFNYYAAGYTPLFSYVLFAIANYIAVKQTLTEKGIKESLCDIKLLTIIFGAFMLLSFIAMALYQCMLARIAIVFVALLFLFIFRDKILGQIKKR